MGRFIFKGSHYRDENGKTYVKDDIVTSDRPLDETFKNSFEKTESRRAITKPETVEEEVKAIDSKFKVVHTGGGRYNVVKTSDDEKINDKTLTKLQAIKLAGKDAPVEDIDESIDER